jgi:hypothetical protein
MNTRVHDACDRHPEIAPLPVDGTVAIRNFFEVALIFAQVVLYGRR